MMQIRSPRRQSGVAMLTAVMVVAFATTVAGAMMVKQNLAVHRSANIIQEDQAWWYLVGLEQWACSLMDRDLEDNQYDHLGEPWATPIDFLPVDEGVLSGRMIDLQGRFNLLTLIGQNRQPDEARKAQFIRLLNALEDIKPGQAEDITSAVMDWMDDNTEPGFPGGAEDGVYLSKKPPYRTPNRAMQSVTELRLIEGISPKIYVALIDVVAVRPGDHKINVNTASAPVLMSLSETMTPATVEGLLKRQIDLPFESDEQFITDSLVAGLGLTTEDVTVKSDYFQAESAATIGNVRLSYVSMLERKAGGKTRVIMHSRNTL